jgi:hypothetical protein
MVDGVHVDGTLLPPAAAGSTVRVSATVEE